MQENDLIGLRVETRTGQRLGRIVHFEVDVETQQVSKYHVAGQKLVADLLGRALLIDRHQVIAITAEKMIVEDLTIEAAERKRAWTPALRPGRAAPTALWSVSKAPPETRRT